MWGQVVCTNDGIEFTSPDGGVEKVQWDELVEVVISSRWMSTFDQRFVWHLGFQRLENNDRRTYKEVAIPFEATGAPELRNRLAKLPGFVSMGLEDFLSSDQEGQILCWRK